MKRKTRYKQYCIEFHYMYVNICSQHAARSAKWNLPTDQQKEKRSKIETVFALIYYLVLYFNPFSLSIRVLNANLYFIFIKRLMTSNDISAIIKLNNNNNRMAEWRSHMRPNNAKQIIIFYRTEIKWREKFLIKFDYSFFVFFFFHAALNIKR